MIKKFITIFICVFSLLFSCTIGNFMDIGSENDEIVYSFNTLTAGYNEEIFKIRADSTGITQLTFTDEGVNNRDPSWSSDGGKIIFSRSGTGYSHIWMMNRDGSSQQQLTYGTAIDSNPTFSPDGMYFSFTRHPEGACVQSFYDGTFTVIDPGISIEAATWLTTEQKVVYRGGTGNGSYYSAYPDGTGIVELFDISGDNIWAPVWSHDGDWIVFLRENIDTYNFEIWRMHNTGEEQVKVANIPEQNAQSPVWSPRGEEILFIIEGKGIYIINRDSTGLKEILLGTYGRACFKGKPR